MNNDELLRMLRNHEDNFVERKSKGVSLSELRQTASAFANTVPEGRTAVLFIGVHDKTGDILGVDNPDALQMKIWDVCHNDCYPEIGHTCQVLDVDGKTVVAVEIPSSKKRPHFTGAAYVRVGSQSRKATEQQYEELILSRNDKAREILKHRHDVFTVIGVNYRLGSNSPTDGSYREMRECRVTACDAHIVSLADIASLTNFSEPLAHVTISYDHAKYRPLLVVTFPR